MAVTYWYQGLPNAPLLDGTIDEGEQEFWFEGLPATGLEATAPPPTATGNPYYWLMAGRGNV